MNRRFFSRAAIACAFVALVMAISAGVWRYGYVQALNQLSRQGAVDLALASDRLTGQLQRYRELASLTADRPAITRIMAGREGPRGKALLLEIADKTGALDVMVVNAQGRVVEAARSDVGIDLSGAIYVRRAMQGALGWGARCGGTY